MYFTTTSKRIGFAFEVLKRFLELVLMVLKILRAFKDF